MPNNLELDDHFTLVEASCLVWEASPFGSVFGGKIRIQARSKHAQLLHQHQGIPDGEYDHVICFKDHNNQDTFLPDVSCVDDVSSHHEDVLLILGSVHAVTGGGKRDPGMRDLALVLKQVGDGKWERIGRVAFWNNVHHFRKSEAETFTLV